MAKKLYVASFKVESFEQTGDGVEGDGGDDGQDDDDGTNDDDAEDLEDDSEHMETVPKSAPEGPFTPQTNTKTGQGGAKTVHTPVKAGDGVDTLQTPEQIAFLYTDAEKGQDMESGSKWEQFLQNYSTDALGDTGLLQEMELLGGESDGDQEKPEEPQFELGKEVVQAIIAERAADIGLKPCSRTKKGKSDKWGPIVVERERRRKNDGLSMLQRAMDLKQKKNLEPLKGKEMAGDAGVDAKRGKDAERLAGSVAPGRPRKARRVDNLVGKSSVSAPVAELGVRRRIQESWSWRLADIVFGRFCYVPPSLEVVAVKAVLGP